MTVDPALDAINEAIHDQWFDLDRLAHDRERSEVRLTLYPGRTRGRVGFVTGAPLDDDLPPPIGELIIGAVEDVEVVDDAGTGWYEVDRVTFDPDACQVVVRATIPLEITVRVRELDVRLERP